MAIGTKRPGFLLDFFVALLAAASVAFVIFAMPDWRFHQAVSFTGLPAILSAAQPPLGNTARLAAMLVAASLVFASVWLLLGALGKPVRRAAPSYDIPGEGGVRLRRADMHPDAPTFRPLSAERDLTEPEDELADFEEMLLTHEVEEDPLPSFLVPERHDSARAEPAAGDDFPCFHGVDEIEAEVAPEPVIEAAPGVAPPPPAPPAFQAAPPPSPLNRPETSPERASAAVPPDASISELMQRLERGLERRGRKLPASTPADSSLDERLRSAIEDLQRISGRSF